MAMYVICAVRDSAVDCFALPMFFRATGEAIRSFADEANRDGSAIAAHPADYELFLLGTYNDQDASVVWQRPESLVTAKATLRAKD